MTLEVDTAPYFIYHMPQFRNYGSEQHDDVHVRRPSWCGRRSLALFVDHKSGRAFIVKVRPFLWLKFLKILKAGEKR